MSDGGLRDLRYAFRALRRSPGFTAGMVLTLALGIGANTAVFTVVHGVLVRPLPYASPDRIVHLVGYDTREGVSRGTISYANFLDWRAQATSFEAMAAYDEWGPTMEQADEPVRLIGASVSAAYFSVLGVHPAAGRFFVDDEESPGSARAVVLSYALWSTRFGSDAGLIGSTVRLSGTPYTVVGVAPRDFEDPKLSGVTEPGPEIWRVSPAYFAQDATNRAGHAYTGIARLKSGLTRQRAQAELDAIAARLEALYPTTNARRAVLLVPIKEHLVAGVRQALLLVFAAAGLVLLVACVNTANLTLARASTRRREVALRAALGASRRRIVSQLLTESVVLAVLGAAAGLMLAYYASGALQQLAGSKLPRVDEVRLGWASLLFAAGAAGMTGVLFGLVPAWHARRADLRAALTDRSLRLAGGAALRGRRTMLVASEVALATMVLVAAGLLARSLWKLQHVDTGFQAAGVLTMNVGIPAGRYDDDAMLAAAYTRLLDAAGAVPGVTGGGASGILPMSGGFNGMGFSIAGRPEPAPGNEGPEAETRAVTPGYFGAVGMRVLRGRGITEADASGAAPVAVISQLTAAKYWPGQDPVGTSISLLGTPRDIVGIVSDIRQFNPAQAPVPAMYVPLPQAPSFMWFPPTLTLRTGGDPEATAPAVRSALRAVEPGLVISDVRPLADVVASTLTAPRLYAVLVGAFAVLALALGAVGVYGVVSLGVAQRVHEFGIRMAVGARGAQVLRSAIGRAMAPVLTGVGAGTVGALALGRALSGMLFEVRATDTPTLVGAVVVLSLTGAAASFIPARRAARVHPMEALRHE